MKESDKDRFGRMTKWSRFHKDKHIMPIGSEHLAVDQGPTVSSSIHPLSKIVGSNASRIRDAAKWIADHGLWLVSVPAILNLMQELAPLNLRLVSLGVIPIIWLCSLLVRDQPAIRTPLDIPVMFLLLMTLVGLYPSVDLHFSLGMGAKTVIEVMLFYTVIRYARSKDRIGQIVLVFVAVGPIVSVVGLLNTQFSEKILPLMPVYNHLPRALQQLRPAGFNANVVGGAIGMVLPLMVASSLTLRSKLWPLVLSATLFSGITFVLTQSRGGLIGLTAALLVIMIWRWRWMVGGLPFLLLGIILLIHWVGPNRVLEFVVVNDSTKSVDGRLEVWQRAVYMLQDFPFTGIGLGMFSKVAPILYPFFLVGPDASIPHAHNIYLEAGVDLGLPGLVAFIAFLTGMFAVAIQSVRSARGSELEPIAVGLFGGQIVYVVHGLFDAITFSSRPATVLWLVFGLTVAIWLKVADRSSMQIKA